MRPLACLPLLLPAVFLCAACEKSEEDPLDPDPGTQVAPISGPSMIVMDVNGVLTTIQAGGGYTEIIFTEVSGGPPPDTSMAVFLAGFQNGNDTVFRIRIGKLEYTGGNPNAAELEGFLAAGARTLTEIIGNGDGLTLEWRDGSGVWYGTSCGAEAGSFEITEIAAQQVGQEHYVKFRAVFSGTFHACDGSGGSVSIANGTLVLRVNDES